MAPGSGAVGVGCAAGGGASPPVHRPHAHDRRHGADRGRRAALRVAPPWWRTELRTGRAGRGGLLRRAVGGVADRAVPRHRRLVRPGDVVGLLLVPCRHARLRAGVSGRLRHPPAAGRGRLDRALAMGGVARGLPRTPRSGDRTVAGPVRRDMSSSGPPPHLPVDHRRRHRDRPGAGALRRTSRQPAAGRHPRDGHLPDGAARRPADAVLRGGRHLPCGPGSAPAHRAGALGGGRLRRRARRRPAHPHLALPLQLGLVRRTPADGDRRRGGLPRHAERNQADQARRGAGPGRGGAGPPGGRSCDGRQVGLPGHHEPRDPHPDERRDRDDRPAAGHRAGRGAA